MFKKEGAVYRIWGFDFIGGKKIVATDRYIDLLIKTDELGYVLMSKSERFKAFEYVNITAYDWPPFFALIANSLLEYENLDESLIKVVRVIRYDETIIDKIYNWYCSLKNRGESEYV